MKSRNCRMGNFQSVRCRDRLSQAVFFFYKNRNHVSEAKLTGRMLGLVACLWDNGEAQFRRSCKPRHFRIANFEIQLCTLKEQNPFWAPAPSSFSPEQVATPLVSSTTASQAAVFQSGSKRPNANGRLPETREDSWEKSCADGGKGLHVNSFSLSLFHNLPGAHKRNLATTVGNPASFSICYWTLQG